MTIIPICRQELRSSARRGRLQSERAWFAGILLVILLGTFASWYFSSGRVVGRYLMSQIAAHSFLFVVIAHAMLILGLATFAALSIAGEMDRKTLGFLLATRLGNAEIVLGKLAVCLSGFFTSIAAGLPVMVLLYALGGVHPRVILIAYAGIISTAFLVVAIGLWVSSGAPDGRRAVSATVLYIIAWLIVPFVVGMTPLLARIGLPPPSFVLSINAWLLSSNPLSLLPLFIGGGVSPSALYHRVAWMCGLELGGGVLLLLGAMARLRSAFRDNVGGDGGSLSRRLPWPAWRFRPRPLVGDDPILWREMYTSRGGLLGQVAGLCIALMIYSGMGYCTFFFARRAFVELWHHGYLAVTATADRPDVNLLVRFFLEDSGPNVPVDAARIDFNLFLRFTTGAMLFMIALITAGIAAETLTTERAKDTWSSLIATPLSGRDILLGKLRASIWRLRGIGITILLLWTLGLISGAVHPLGCLAAILVVAAAAAFYLMAGLLVALRAQDHRTAAGRGLSLVVLPISSVLLPFLLPAAINSILWGAASTPLVAWLSLASYREVQCAFRYPIYPMLQCININTGEGVLAVILTCTIGILATASGALWMWNYSLANFDRLVGRPTKNEPVARVPRVLPVPAPAT